MIVMLLVVIVMLLVAIVALLVKIVLLMMEAFSDNEPNRIIGFVP